MDRDRDEELLRGRGYGTDFDDPHAVPRPGRRYAELVGGPLDGLLLDITGWTPQEISTGAALMTELGQFGAGGRCTGPGREARAGGVGRRHSWSRAGYEHIGRPGAGS
ncbi:hypothetical protein [Streptomyces chrestomyceticus]|uniref:hypothetical protein n=1 Tax=Streptomyces chrestomyceticus TaxID=68185 RepID=UPI0033E60264